MQEEWFDKYGLIHAHKDRDSENGILFTVEYYLLKSLLKKLTDEDVKSFKIAIAYLRNDNGSYSATHGGGDHWSHDNHTAKVCMESFLKLKSDIWLPDWKKRVHPRDLVFYLFLTPYIGWLARPLLWIPALTMIISCIQDTKTRQGRKIIKTDGKLLTFVRCISTRRKSWTMNLTWKLCSWIIKHNSPFNSWDNIFEMYFKEPEHPNRVLSKEYFK